MTKNRPEVGLERVGRFIHHVQWEYLTWGILASNARHLAQANVIRSRNKQAT
jgi:hypothetical protein